MPSHLRSRHRSPVSLTALAAVIALAASACGGDDGASGDSDRSGADITVFAASSLTDAFTEIGTAFTAAHPGSDVTFSFGASSELVAQIIQGAPADVLASADQASMQTLTDADGTARDPQVFAHNRLEIIVEPGNPLGVTDLADLAASDMTVVLCAEEVPCGSYATQVLSNAGVTVQPASLEENARAVVSKVTLGEADAGIVYVTDVAAAGDAASGVEIPDDVNVLAEYPIAVTNEASPPATAQQFVDFVLSDAGQEILAAYGFAPA